MSTSFEYVLFPELGRDEAAPASQRVIAALQEAGIIETDYTETEFEKGYAPQRRNLHRFYVPDTSAFLRLRHYTHVKPSVGFGFQGPELTQIEEVICPDCGPRPISDNIQTIHFAAGDFHNTGDIPEITCACGATHRATKFRSTPELTFAHLCFSFPNWPPLDKRAEGPDGEGWLIDIPSLMERAAGSPARHSYGRL